MGMNNLSSDQFLEEKRLLSRIALDDEAAFRTIFDRYRRMVYSYARKVCSDEESAEDILLTVFLKIWQHPDPASIDNLKAYLQTTTRNIAFNALRSREIEARVYQRLSEINSESHNETEELIWASDVKKLIAEAVDLLPPQQKLVYTLCKEEGLKFEEVAEKLSLSTLTVKTHLKLAIRFLKAYLKKNHDISFLITVSILSLSHINTPGKRAARNHANSPEISKLKKMAFKGQAGSL